MDVKNLKRKVYQSYYMNSVLNKNFKLKYGRHSIFYTRLVKNVELFLVCLPIKF